jgi:hypothetical protein
MIEDGGTQMDTEKQDEHRCWYVRTQMDAEKQDEHRCWLLNVGCSQKGGGSEIRSQKNLKSAIRNSQCAGKLIPFGFRAQFLGICPAH